MDLTNFVFFCSAPVTNTDLIDLCEKLWTLDKNRLTPDKDYKLDLQGRTRYSYDGPDRAKDPLFEHVDDKVFKRETYQGMKSCDSYCQCDKFFWRKSC